MYKKSMLVGFLITSFAFFGYRMNSNTKGATMHIESSAFNNNEVVPKKHTCEGDNVSPPLTISNVPPKTVSLALICDDPDAPKETPWVHWVVYNLPGNLVELPEDADIQALGGNEGVTDFDNKQYGGPCPPKGHGVHRYFFKLYALDTTLPLQPGATKQQVLDAMKDHILAQAKLVGTYERSA